MEVNHSANQKDYVDWKYKILKTITKSAPKLRNGNGNRVAYRFYTKCLPEITDLFRTFYKNGKKFIPDKFNINELSLAVWFMDDGSKSRNALYLNTQQFTHLDQVKLQKLLKEKFGVGSNLNRDKTYERIRIITSDARKFCDLIRPYIPKSMEYKLV